jgi:NADH-quinone oxidoreductase subunit M
MVLLGAFSGSWATYQQGSMLPLALAATAVSGVVLGALYMLWFAQRLLFGAARAPDWPQATLADLGLRERAILVTLLAAVFWLGLAPDEPLRKTEMAARQYQQLVQGTTAKVAVGHGAVGAAGAAPAVDATVQATASAPAGPR